MARPNPSIVLLSERTLSADYRVLFEGIFATMQTTKVPALAMRHFVAPKIAADASGRAVAAPLGVRRIESALRASGLSADDVAVTTPEAMHKLIGPGTRIVAVSSGDPLGGGMSNTTSSSFWPGELYTARWTRELHQRLAELKNRYGFRVVTGGPGAWQWARQPELARTLGIDTIFEGYFEALGPKYFAELLAGGEPREHVVEAGTAGEGIAPILGPSMLGVVELSRGCGFGCRFCTMAGRKMIHLPEETILADVQTNVAGGKRSIVSSSEDFFRYGADGANVAQPPSAVQSASPARLAAQPRAAVPHGGKVNFARLAGLLERMRRINGLSFMQIDHANVGSILQFSPDQLREIRRLLQWGRPSQYLWVNVGVETANGQLLAVNAPGKLFGHPPEDWEEMVLQAAGLLEQAGYFPVFSLVLGLPGETKADVERTMRLAKRLSERPAAIFPVFYEPVTPGTEAERFGLSRMRLEHLELYSYCYEVNFRWVPKLYWDNQRCGGVGLAKRMAIQWLGRAEVLAWRKAFRSVRRRLS